MKKTNAARILDRLKIDYELKEYKVDLNDLSAIHVAKDVNMDIKTVFKTLVAQGTSKELYVFVIPVAEELNLKVAASITGEKKIEMINVKDMLKYTGYIRGGCSPIGLKKNYKTYLDKSCKVLKYIIVSAGKIGYQIKISPNDLLNVVSGEVEELTK